MPTLPIPKDESTGRRPPADAVPLQSEWLADWILERAAAGLLPERVGRLPDYPGKFDLFEAR